MRPVWLLLSAPMGAGKDTVAAGVLPVAGYPNFRVRPFSAPLRADVDRWLFQRQCIGEDLMLADAAAGGVPAAHRDELLARIDEALAAGGSDPVTSHTRSPQMRSLLQWYGTDVRRAADPDYWVRRTMSAVSDDLDAGVSVVTPDCRFPNEVELPRSVFDAVAVRLEVSEEVQRARLLARDGVLPAPSAFRHPSETTMAAYAGFDAWVDTSALSIDESLSAVAAALADARVGV